MAFLLQCILAIANSALHADEAQWGELQVRFIYDGVAPAPEVLPGVPGVAKPIDESLIVNQKNNGIENVLVWLRESKNNPPSVHPDFALAAPGRIAWPVKGCRYVPHVLSIRTTQSLAVQNLDAFAHNAHCNVMANTIVSPILPADGISDFRFERPEILPVKAGCNIHPWENGWLVVKDHPYVGISDPDGFLKIAKLPVGEWEFQFWHERTGYLKEFVVNGKEETWPKGRKTIEIKAEATDLGELHVKGELLKR